jgi:hypothetical protein
MKTDGRLMWAQRLAMGVLAGAVLAGVVPTGPVAAQEVTYADVAPVIGEKCVECHRPNSIAPMSLVTYEDVRPWVPKIEFAVENRVMPPWGLNPDVGIQDYKNHRALSHEQRDLLLRWIDEGAPRGDGEASSMAWVPDDSESFVWDLEDRIGPPDMIIQGPVVAVTEEGPDRWYDVTIPTGLTEAKWIRAVEVRPSDNGSRTVVHHALASIVQDEPQLAGLPVDLQGQVRGPGLLYNYAAGKGGHIFKPDAGKLLLPGSAISWELHTTTKGIDVPEASVTLGLWFHDEPPPYRTILRTFMPRNANGDLDILPGQIAVHQGSWVMPAPVRIEAFQPHMHMRGKAMLVEAIYPNGRRETLTFVDNFQWDLQNTYIYADDAAPLLPKGTTLVVTSWHDNTAENPNNPDPRQEIGWGARKVDEMSIGWFDMTYLDQDYFDQLVAERQAGAAVGGGP